ncbi:unnamed protein product [Symbiodinium necroappetens]|uniref:Uncharacterized protein n=1 Tax=Symbiodinium necroappetens TaxID=1628268 RepID=A0A812SNG9_9DINO|nr:unnamed protein product [Symbiodinium necroappetens]
MLRIRPGGTSTTPPSNPEELRLRHCRIGLAWDFVKPRHSTRAWLPDNCVDCFRVLSDHVLGSSVAGLRSACGQGPMWSLVLSYVLELRKAAYRYIRDGQCACLDNALLKACEGDKGSGKGRGMWDRQWGKSSKTPDGKQLCFKYNKQIGCAAEPSGSYELNYFQRPGASSRRELMPKFMMPLIQKINSGATYLQVHASTETLTAYTSAKEVSAKLSQTDSGFAHRVAGLPQRDRMRRVSCRVDCRALAFKLAAGQISDSPFTEEMLACGRQLVWSELKSAGCRLPVDHMVPGQPFCLAAVEELLRLAGDSDFAACYTGRDCFAKGVRLGVDVDLPRVPAVFTAKTRWRVYDEEDANAGLRENYVSGRDHADEVQAQFEREAALGAMYETSIEQARADLGELSLASLGAIEKKDGSYRVLHDGTHGLAVNSKIRVQDQIRNPSAGDLRCATQALPSAFFVLSGDVARAHRLVKVAQCDWKYQCCRTGAKGDMVWVNCVGTFGIASAAYH